MKIGNNLLVHSKPDLYLTQVGILRYIVHIQWQNETSMSWHSFRSHHIFRICHVLQHELVDGL